jgi:hypothetical protein
METADRESKPSEFHPNPLLTLFCVHEARHNIFVIFLNPSVPIAAA